MESFTSTYSINSVEHTLSRYQNYKSGLVRTTKMDSDAPEERRREAVSNEEVQKSSDEVLHALQGQHAALELDKLRREGKALDGLSREELCALEIEQHRALESVLKKKEELLVRLVRKSNKERDRHQAIQERTREIPYLQLFPENSTGFSTSSKAVSLSNCPTQFQTLKSIAIQQVKLPWPFSSAIAFSKCYTGFIGFGALEGGYLSLKGSGVFTSFESGINHHALFESKNIAYPSAYS
ncbi:hypothetical protein ACLB2K_071090 [Fragaria x ananassa]